MKKLVKTTVFSRLIASLNTIFYNNIIGILLYYQPANLFG